ncbi:uncharacterized protein L201_005212 [Kwoniella dendrophila CBS 6074]|uniref:Uncharacterized protein n=1 Tax=Kwoniella dendrophila CBS 6074 TaxID=1295534 RepID=A0AAX4JZK3_9TREE
MSKLTYSPSSYKSKNQPGPSRTNTGKLGNWTQRANEEHWEDIEDENMDAKMMKTPDKKVYTSGRESPTSSTTSSPSRRIIQSPRNMKSRTPSRKPIPNRNTLKQARPLPSQARPPQRRPSIPITDTLNLLLLPLRLILAPLNILLAPFYAHLANGLLLITIGSLFAYFILPLIPSLVLKLIGRLIKYISSDFISRNFGFTQNTDLGLGKEVFLLPAKTLATPACLLTGLFCHNSLLSRNDINGTTIIPAKPFWQNFKYDQEVEKDDVDIGEYARALTKEARGARDIFDSVRMLGQGGVAGGLEYVRIWELAVTVNTGSTLEGKGYIAEQIRELGDMTRDLSDEIVHIDSKTVNAFSWLQWEFRDLVNLLSLPPATRPSSAILSRKLHSLLIRLQTELESIYTLTSEASKHASLASMHGQGLDSELSRTANGLKYESDREPGWKFLLDKSTHFLIGGEPSKIELIKRDLKITTKTIGNIRSLSRNLEETRSKIKVYRDQIGMFDASIMGFHLGQNEIKSSNSDSDQDELIVLGGLGPEEEIRVLNEVVEGLARSVGMAKQEARSGRISILEIDQ